MSVPLKMAVWFDRVSINNVLLVIRDFHRHPAVPRKWVITWTVRRNANLGQKSFIKIFATRKEKQNNRTSKRITLFRKLFALSCFLWFCSTWKKSSINSTCLLWRRRNESKTKKWLQHYNQGISELQTNKQLAEKSSSEQCCFRTPWSS